MSEQGGGPAAVFQMLNAAQVTAVTSAAIQLNVFATLSGKETDAATVAAAIGCPPRSTKILLDAMTVFGLAAKSGDHYRLTPMAEEHLVPGKPQYAGDASGILSSKTMWEGLSRLAEAVKRDGTVLEEHAETPQHPFWKTFAQASGSMAFAGAMALDHLLGPWIREQKRVRILDVAAGSGIYGFTLVKNHPNVELTVLDWPNVLAETKVWAQRLGVDAARVEYLEGNLFETPFGGPFDAILFSHVFHHFDAPTCQTLMNKASGALAPSGRVIVHDFLNDGSNPAAIGFSITMLVWTRHGEAFGPADYQTWMKTAGLKAPSIHALPGMPTSFVIAQK